MGLWDKLTGELIDIIEWLDDTRDTMVWRFPRYENEIKNGAKLIVRESAGGRVRQRGRSWPTCSAAGHVHARHQEPADPVHARRVEVRVRVAVQGRGLLRLDPRRSPTTSGARRTRSCSATRSSGRPAAAGVRHVRVPGQRPGRSAAERRRHRPDVQRRGDRRPAPRPDGRPVRRRAGRERRSPCSTWPATRTSWARSLLERIKADFEPYGLEVDAARRREHLAAAGGRGGDGQADQHGRARQPRPVHEVPGGQRDGEGGGEPRRGGGAGRRVRDRRTSWPRCCSRRPGQPAHRRRSRPPAAAASAAAAAAAAARRPSRSTSRSTASRPARSTWRRSQQQVAAREDHAGRRWSGGRAWPRGRRPSRCRSCRPLFANVPPPLPPV